MIRDNLFKDDPFDAAIDNGDAMLPDNNCVSSTMIHHNATTAGTGQRLSIYTIHRMKIFM